MRTYYEVLGVSETASDEIIRSTYLRLISIYHPDHNKDPQATEMTTKLNTVYAVLGVPVERSKYDKWLQKQREQNVGAPPPSSQSQPSQSAPPPPEIRCIRCGALDSTLRLALFYWVFSAVVITKRGGKSGIWCDRCRAVESLKFTAITGLLGWWGFPFGPIYTVPALWTNGKGGKQEKDTNAQLLRLVALQLYQTGHSAEPQLRNMLLAESLLALRESLKLQYDADALNFSNQLLPYTLIADQRTKRFWRAVPAIASATIVFILGVSIVAIAGSSSASTASVSSPAIAASYPSVPASAPSTYAPPSNVLTPSSSLRTGTEMRKRQMTNGSGRLTIENNLSEDAVINITVAGTNRVIRRFYVKASEKFTERNFALGNYELYYATGSDWNTATKRFNGLASNVKLESQLDFDKYGDISITLHSLVGNVKGTPVAQNDIDQLMNDDE